MICELGSGSEQEYVKSCSLKMKRFVLHPQKHGSWNCFLFSCSLRLPGREDGLPLWDYIRQVSVRHRRILQDEEGGTWHWGFVVVVVVVSLYSFYQLMSFPVWQREEEKEENRLSEEAERSVDQPQDDEDEAITAAELPEEADARPGVTYQIENENRAPSRTIVVPAIVTAT